MALDLRPNCERCDRDLPPDAVDARICSYECTFCSACVAALDNVCPNCGGGFQARPVRPSTEWRPGLSVALRPPSARRVHMTVLEADAAALSARLKDIPPQDR